MVTFSLTSFPFLRPSQVAVLVIHTHTHTQAWVPCRPGELCPVLIGCKPFSSPCFRAGGCRLDWILVNDWWMCVWRSHGQVKVPQNFLSGEIQLTVFHVSGLM